MKSWVASAVRRVETLLSEGDPIAGEIAELEINPLLEEGEEEEEPPRYSWGEEEEEEELVQPSLIQPKLTVGAADDPLEREADEVAAQVMRQSSIGTVPIGTDVDTQVQRFCAELHMRAPASGQPGEVVRRGGSR